MIGSPGESLAPFRGTRTGLAGGAAIFLAFLGYCGLHGLIFGGDIDLSVSAGWATAATIAWGGLLFAGWRGRARLRDLAVGAAREQAGLFVLAMAMMLVTDAIAMQAASLFWDEPRGLVDVVTRAYGFLPRAAMLSAILMLSLILWHRHETTRRPAPASATVAWLEFPESPHLRLRCEEVVLIRSAGNYSELVGARRTWLVRVPIGDVAARLLPRGFVRVHRRSIVNVRHVRAIARDGGGRPTVELIGGERVLVGRSYRGAIDALTDA